MKIIKNEKGQAVAPVTQKSGKDAFEKINCTEIRWLGSAGIFINSYRNND